jgi:hypothetical protein
MAVDFEIVAKMICATRAFVRCARIGSAKHQLLVTWCRSRLFLLSMISRPSRRSRAASSYKWCIFGILLRHLRSRHTLATKLPGGSYFRRLVRMNIDFFEVRSNDVVGSDGPNQEQSIQPRYRRRANRLNSARASRWNKRYLLNVFSR